MRKSWRPLVTICMPTYNGRAYLRESIESTLTQTFENFELVIVDDASGDDTACIAAEYARRDRRVRVHVNQGNLGLVRNWNRCVELAQGEWIKFLFQDDRLEPNCLEQMLAVCSGDIALVVCRRRSLFQEGVPEQLKRGYEEYVAENNVPRRFPGRSFVDPAVFAKYLLEHPAGNCIGEPTATLIHRSAFERFGYFNQYLIQLADWEHASRVAVQTGFSYVDDVLATFRLHAESCTAVNVSTRGYRANVLDPLLILHELAHSPLYERVRLVARRSRPRVNLVHRLVEASGRARQLMAVYRSDSQLDTHAQREWEEVIAAYPRLAQTPLSYRLARLSGRVALSATGTRGRIIRRFVSLAARTKGRG